MPWAPRSRPELPYEIPGGFCKHNRMVAFWQETPSLQAMQAAGAVRIEQVGVRELQAGLARMCPFGCVDLTLKRGAIMGVVKGMPDIDPCPDGPTRLVCVDNYTKTGVDTQWGKKDFEQFVFESEHINPKTNKPFLVFARFNAVIGGNSKLNEFLVSWRGKKFTPEELTAFDCEKVVGACAYAQILQDHKDDGKVYANIKSIMGLPPGTPKLAPSGTYIRVKDRAAQTAAAGAVAGDVDDDLPF